MVIYSSSLTLISKIPRSGESIVACLIISSKHCRCNYYLIGQIPESLHYDIFTWPDDKPIFHQAFSGEYLHLILKEGLY